jgi:hypothetical protein
MLTLPLDYILTIFIHSAGKRDSGHEVSTLTLVLLCMIDTSGRINAKPGGVNALPRSPALEKLMSAPSMITGMRHLRSHLTIAVHPVD